MAVAMSGRMGLDRVGRRRTMTAKHRQAPGRLRRTDRPVPEMAAWVEQVRALPDIRWEKVAAVRAALAEGNYGLDQRLAEMTAALPDELEILARMSCRFEQ